MIRLGLCCKFYQQPIVFKTTTAKYIKNFTRTQQLNRLSALCLHNAHSLYDAIVYCHDHEIGCFRVNSQILPLKTHPNAGYDITQLPDASAIKKTFTQCRTIARRWDIRLTFHPDQFILLSSPKPDVTTRSIEELDYQSEVAELIGADVINIHAGGGYGDKAAALKRMAEILPRLKKRIRTRLTLENDDRIYSPADLLPFCRANHIPMVYDVHHHRCLADHLSIQQATDLALKTWDREPLFHLSSPKGGWKNSCPSFHDDYIQNRDFPKEWIGLAITVEIEAKAKELAIHKLAKYLNDKK